MSTGAIRKKMKSMMADRGMTIESISSLTGYSESWIYDVLRVMGPSEAHICGWIERKGRRPTPIWKLTAGEYVPQPEPIRVYHRHHEATKDAIRLKDRYVKSERIWGI